MAFRGRGRGRGRGGYGGGYGPAKQVPFELFPEIEELGTASGVKENSSLVIWFYKFEKFCKSSPYYIVDANEGLKKTQGSEIERFSDRHSEKIRPKQPLSHFIKMDHDHVPAELAKSSRKEKHGIKKVKWNPESDTLQLDDFIAKKLKERQGEQVIEKKEEEEDEDDDRNEEDEEEDSDDGDYTKNVDFDDDEDDFNMDDENDDEPIM